MQSILFYCMACSLAKVSLKQTLKCLSVSGLITSHLMNGIMDSIQVQSLGSLSQIELTCGSAVLGKLIDTYAIARISEREAA